MPCSSTFPVLLEAAQAMRPATAIVLGSGMGAVGARVQRIASIPFVDVPGMEATSIPGHSGRLTLGKWAGCPLLLFEGRIHFYESGRWRSVTASIHLAHFLGARQILLTNAAGGIREDLAPGTLMAIRDQIEWTHPNAWQQKERQPSPYAHRLRALLHNAAQHRGIPLSEAIYAGVTGPCYETPAEIQALRACGADAVGMSTVREARAAWELGLECAAISLITNRAAGLTPLPIAHEEVLHAAARAGERLADLVDGFLEQLGSER
jgi:purine-nucleoside phosphorylase